MFCNYCGSNLREGAKFCHHCGKPVKSVESSIKTSPNIKSDFSKPKLDMQKKGAIMLKAGVREILSALKDQDIIAPSTTGEISCNSDLTQSAFMKLLKKGLLGLVLLLSVWSTYAQAIRKVTPGSQKSETSMQNEWTLKKPLLNSLEKTHGFGNSSLKVKVYGGTISGEAYDTFSNNEKHNLRFRYAGIVKEGDKIKVNAEAIGVIEKMAEQNSISISISSTSLYQKKQLVVHKDRTKGTEKPKGLNCEYKVKAEDSFVNILINYVSTSNFVYRIEINYKLEGSQEASHFAVDTDASSESDEINTDGIDGIVGINDENNSNNWQIPIAVLAVLGASATVVYAKKKKHRNREKDSEEENEEEKKVTYEMRISKNFGDTLVPGAVAQKVYARIVCIPEDGKASTDYDLTARISIYGDNYLRVSNQRVVGEYMSADVEAPQDNNIPSEAILNFRLSGGGGSFTNRMHFKIQKSEIIFFQENLTLPACSDEVWRLPFAILGGSKSSVVEACESCLKAYDVKIEFDESKGLYYAVISEKIKSKKEPGTYEYFNLGIKVGTGVQEISDSLPLYRFHMGLKFDTHGTISCYLNGKSEVAKTIAELIYFDWDPKTNEILTIYPVPTEFNISAQGKTEQKYIDKLGITCKPTSITSENGRQLEIYPVRGVLDAPTRFNATITLTADCGEGRRETIIKEVLMTSQPVRQNVTMAILDEDRRIGEGLLRIQKSIWDNGEYNRLFPLYKMIEVMLDGYDGTYGYDKYQVQTVKNVYQRFLDGDMTGANATATRVTLADEMALFVDSFLQTSEEVENSMGFFTRMAVGVTTLGISETVFTGLQVVRDMKATAQQGGDTWDVFVAGVKVVATEFIMENTGDYVFNNFMGVTQKYAPKQYEAVTDSINKIQDRTKDYFSSNTGKKTSKVLEKSKIVKSKASNQADDAINAFKKNPELSDLDSKLDKVYQNGQKHGKAKVDDLQAAEWLMKNNPTPENVRLYKNKVLEVQRDKFAMQQLNNLQDGNTTRAAFNKELDEVYRDVDLEVREILKKKGYDMDDTPFAATSSNKADLKTGKKVTYDRDVTYRTRDGKDVPQEIAQEAYEKAFYKRTTGIDAPNDKAAGEWARMHDQSVVQKGSPISYEDDLNPVIKEWDKKLTNAERTGKVVTYKSTEWFEQTNQMIHKANTLEDKGLRLDMLEQALSKRQEATRQMVKQFKYVHERDVAAQSLGAVSKITEKMRFGMEISSRLFTTGKDALTLTQVEAILAKNDLTLELLSSQLGDTLKSIG